jgi:hypothetical protein
MRTVSNTLEDLAELRALSAVLGLSPLADANRDARVLDD